ncbi:hypothetical protein JXA32_03885 [Candidatus Sumerlaeota bacterium]|nr:hypothetical protein [Candidatus Sumerlaeota bacterium]
MIQTTGVAAPDALTPAKERRLDALERARQDAWLKLYDEVRALPWQENVLIGDQLTIDPRARARVLNYIWNAEVLDQRYDPDEEMAEVTIAVEIAGLSPLISSPY